MLETQDRQHEERYKNRWYGKYRAFVRDNNDPERLGRCRLEIPAVLGTGQPNWSEWAWPCFPFGGNDDTGTFLVPDPGATVWAEFEGGHVQYPIWTGVWLAKSNPGEQPEESKRLCPVATCLDCEDKVLRQGNPADDLEHRKYHGYTVRPGGRREGAQCPRRIEPEADLRPDLRALRLPNSLGFRPTRPFIRLTSLRRRAGRPIGRSCAGRGRYWKPNWSVSRRKYETRPIA